MHMVSTNRSRVETSGGLPRKYFFLGVTNQEFQPGRLIRIPGHHARGYLADDALHYGVLDLRLLCAICAA